MKIINPNHVDGYSTFARASTGTYFDRNKVMQTAAEDVQRVNWNPATGVFEGVLVEPERTNLILNSASLTGLQTRTVETGKKYALTFYGTGSLSLSGAYLGTLQGVGAYPAGGRARLIFVAATNSITITASTETGAVQYAQLEQGAFETSYIPTTSAVVTRAADVVGPPGMFQTSFPQPHPVWVSTTTYSQGQVVAAPSPSTRLFRSLVNDNLGFNPPDHSVKDSPTAKWVDAGPVNYFACVDQKVSTPSVGPGSLHTTALKLYGPANVVGLVGIKGTKAHIAFNDLQGNIYTNSSSASIFGTSAVLVAHPGGSIVSVCVENSAGYGVEIGEILAGTYNELGATQYGHSFTLTDFSRKDTDEFGTTTFVKRPNAKRMSASVIVPKWNYNNVIVLMEAVAGRPTLFVASDDPEYSSGAIVYGFFEDFRLEIPYATEALCRLEIQGLI